MTDLESTSNMLTVDVEDYFHVSAFADNVARDNWEGMQSRVERNVERLLEIFSDQNVQATFFVLGWVAERYPDLVQRISSNGHEVACHGYSHQLVYKQSREEFREETYRAKSILEDLSGTPVHGYRAASYSVVGGSLWALDILAEAGFTYDSSIFPVRHDRYGLSGSPLETYVVNTESGATITEVPLTVLPLAGLNIPVSGGGYFRIFPYSFIRWAYRRLNRGMQRPVVFYLHPWEIDPGQPRINGSLLSRFRHYFNLNACEGRLLKLLEEFEFQPVSEFLKERKAPLCVFGQNELAGLRASA